MRSSCRQQILTQGGGVRRRQLGQSMAEYLVVAAALIGGSYLVNNTACPASSCISTLLTVMHDNYEGYSHSLSAVHQYGELQGEGFESEWDDDEGDDGSSGGGSGGSVDIPVDGLTRSDSVISTDGSTTYGTLLAGQYLVDGDGNVIGSYDGATGEVTIDGGGTYGALVEVVVLDEDGNQAELEAVVICGSGTVLGFGYRSGATGDFHSSLTLEEMDVTGFCTAPSYGVVGTDGEPTSGAIVGDNYYASTLTTSVDIGSPQTPSGEVIYFDLIVPDEDIYDGSSPAIGEPIDDCAVMVTGWDADPDVEPLDRYLNGDPNPRVGSLDPLEGVACTALTVVSD